MRPLSAIIAAFLLAAAVPASARADAPAATKATQPEKPGCHCPRVQRRHAAAPRRHLQRHARIVRPAAPPETPPPAAITYNPMLPSPHDSAYDRAMVLHFRSPVVSGFYIPDPGFAPTPPVRGVIPYRMPAGATVMQYDGATGEYIALAQPDAQRVLASVAPPAAPKAP